MNTHTYTSFTPSLIQPALISQIAEHKWYLSERLGRDVGMKVAELDYRLNVQKPAAPVEKMHWFFVLLERLAATHGVRALAQANYTARGMAPFASPTSSNFGAQVSTERAAEQRRAA